MMPAALQVNPSSRDIANPTVWTMPWNCRSLASLGMTIIDGVGALYALHPFTNSTRLRTAIPDGPLAIQGFASSIQAVPAMSR